MAAKSCEAASRYDSNMGVCVQSLADVTLQREVFGFGSKESVSALFASAKVRQQPFLTRVHMITSASVFPRYHERVVE
jgi:hypothetical protein